VTPLIRRVVEKIVFQEGTRDEETSELRHLVKANECSHSRFGLVAVSKVSSLLADTCDKGLSGRCPSTATFACLVVLYNCSLAKRLLAKKGSAACTSPSLVFDRVALGPEALSRCFFVGGVMASSSLRSSGSHFLAVLDGIVLRIWWTSVGCAVTVLCRRLFVNGR
jgi:hypothetical protein